MTGITSDESLAAAAYSLLLDDMAVDVLGRFGESGIDGLLLKGASFAAWLWPGERRSYGDVDLLVSPANYEAAGALLRGWGFVTVEERAHGAEAEKSRPWQRSDGLVVDLHRGLVGINLPDLPSWDILWARRERMPVGSQSLLALDEPARALHVVLHTAQHNRQEKPLRDLRRALERLTLDVWREAAALSVELDAVEAFGGGLHLLDAGTRLARTLEVDERITVDVALRMHAAPKLAHGLERLAKAEGFAAKSRVVTRRLAPAPAYMRHSYALARRGRLGLVVAYPWRWISLTAGGPRALIHWRRARRIAQQSHVNVGEGRLGPKVDEP